MIVKGGAALAAGALAIAALVSLAGCQASGATSQPEPTIPIVATASPLTSAVMFTRGLASADLDVTARTQVGDTVSDITGRGVIDLDYRFGTFDGDTDGTRTRQVVNDLAVYVQDAPPGGPWRKLPRGTTTDLSGLTAPLAGLGSVEGESSGATDTVDGQRVTRYTGRIPVTEPSLLGTVGLTAADTTALGTAWQGTSMDVTAWVDGGNRIVRVERSYATTAPDGTAVRGQSTTDLTDFSAQVQMRAPDGSIVSAT